MKTTKTINKDNTIQPGRLARPNQRWCPTVPHALGSITYMVGVAAMFALFLMTVPAARAVSTLGYQVSATTGFETPVTDSGTMTAHFPSPDYGVTLPTVRFGSATADVMAWANYRTLKASAAVLGKAGPLSVTEARGTASFRDVLVFPPPTPHFLGAHGSTTVALSMTGAGSAIEQAGWGDFAEMDAQYHLLITAGTGTNAAVVLNKFGVWVSRIGGTLPPTFTGDPVPAGPFTVEVPFIFGTPFDLNASLTVWAYFSGNPAVSGLGRASADFSHTFSWLGILTVHDENGNLVTDYTLTSESGTDWTRPPNTADTAPTITCPAPAIVACTSADGATATVTVGIGDTDIDPLTVTWTVDGVLIATHLLAAGATSDSLVNQPFGFGPHTVSVSVTDGKSDPVTCGTTVTVTAHDAPVPTLATLPTIQGECSANVTETPTATDLCAAGGVVSGTTTDPLSYTAQGTYTVTWTYADPHDPTLFTTQQQTVVVKDVTPPTITCPPNVVDAGPVPAAATTMSEFLAQGGTITDNCDPNGTVNSSDVANGTCTIVITRTYAVTDAAGNESRCEQTITLNRLFADGGIIWHQPLARNGTSEDTDPSAGGTLKYRFTPGSTIPIQIHAQGCTGDVTANANVTATVAVFGDTDCDDAADAGDSSMDISYNGVGEAGGVMDKVDGHLKYSLDTKKLVQTFKCYILQVTITDSSTGESRVETVPLQSR